MFFALTANAQTPSEPPTNDPSDCRDDAADWQVHPDDNKSWHICDNAAAIGYRVVVPQGVKLYTLGGDFVQNSVLSDYRNRIGRYDEYFTTIGNLGSIMNFNFNPHSVNGGFQGVLHQNYSGISSFHGVWNYEGQEANPVLGWRTDSSQVNDNTRLQIGFIDNGDNFNEYISVLHDGKVGIGTTQPEYQLHVAGDFYAQHANMNSIKINNGSNAPTITSFSANTNLGSSDASLPTQNAVKTYVDNQVNNLNTQITTADDWTLSGNDIYNNNSGNVGINTVNPKEKLQIGNAFTFHDGGTKYIGFNRYWDNATQQNKRLITGSSMAMAWSGEQLSFHAASNSTAESEVANDNVCLSIFPNGQVVIGEQKYIGTPFSDYALSVDGLIVAKSIAVEKADQWADFVFDEGYELPTLESVKKHIKANKHLPGIPTAAEVTENGVDLLDMQVKLLQKIEEMTLYMIQLKEENEALQKRITNLEK